MAYQKFPDSKILGKELNSGKLNRIYLFLGEEEGQKEKMIRLIIEKSVPNNEYSTAKFHAENGELQDASGFIMAGSMFSETKVCVILNIETLKSKSREGTMLLDVIENFPDNNILILTSSENRIPSILTKKAGNIKVYQFWKFFEKDLKNYIITELKKNNVEIHTESVSLLIDLTGRDIKKIDEALFNILNCGEKNITIDVIRNIIPDTKEISVFEFIDSLFLKNKDTFHHLARVLEAGNNELMLLKLITRQAELIEKYLFLIKNNETSAAALQEIGINQRNTDTFLKCVKNFTLSGIKNVFPIIHRTDNSLKSYAFSGSISRNPLFNLVSTLLI